MTMPDDNRHAAHGGHHECLTQGIDTRDSHKYIVSLASVKVKTVALPIPLMPPAPVTAATCTSNDKFGIFIV
jgi:hypothetical protein